MPSSVPSGRSRKVAKSRGHFCSSLFRGGEWGYRRWPMDLSSRSIGGKSRGRRSVGHHHLRVASLHRMKKGTKGRNMISFCCVARLQIKYGGDEVLPARALSSWDGEWRLISETRAVTRRGRPNDQKNCIAVGTTQQGKTDLTYI